VGSRDQVLRVQVAVDAQVSPVRPRSAFEPVAMTRLVGTPRGAALARRSRREEYHPNGSATLIAAS
jgi:hypothetical protein